MLTLSGSLTVYLEAKRDIFVEPGYSATDAIDGDITSHVQFTTPPTSQALGSFSIVYTVTDSVRNSASQTRAVIVRDTTPPTIQLNDGRVIPLDFGQTFNDPGAIASDLVDGDLTSSIIVTGTDNLALNRQVVNTNVTLNYRCTDRSSNTATATRIVTIVDLSVPVITLNGFSDVIIQASSVSVPFTDPGATCSDRADGDLTANPSGRVDNTVVANYTIVYTCSSKDGRQQANPVTRTIHVVDTTPPVLQLVGSDSMTVEGATVFRDPGYTISDNVDTIGQLDPLVTVTGRVNTSLPANTKVIIVYAARDTHSNVARSLTRLVTIVDTTVPVIRLNGNPTVEVEAATVYNDAGATATDTLDGTVAVQVSNPVNLFPTSTPALFSVVYTATDAASNAATPLTRTVRVVDTKPPTLTLSGDASVTVNAATFYADAGATAVDALDGAVQVTMTGSVDLYPKTTPAVFTLTYTARDKAGNVANPVTRTVRVVSSPIDCVLSDWAAASPCSASCAGGTLEQTRVIAVEAEHGGAECNPNAPRSRVFTCNTQPCPIDCVASWAEWSSCSATCDRGQRVRYLNVTQPSNFGGRTCPSLRVQVEPCVLKACEDCLVPTNGPNSAPCFNGGTCVDKVPVDGKFTCSCPRGFTNTNCQGGTILGSFCILASHTFSAFGDCLATANGPNGKACAHLGRCVDTAANDKTFTCDCSNTGFTGPNCEDG